MFTFLWSMFLSERSVEKHSQEGASTQRSLRCAPPDFLSRSVALISIVRFSSRKTAYVVVASSAK